MRGPTLGDSDAVTDAGEYVVVAEARAAYIDAARPDAQDVVEDRGCQIPNVCFDDGRLVAGVLERAIAGGELVEVRDACNLEPHEIGRVVCNPLRVGFSKAHAHVRREAEALHGLTLRWWRDQSASLRLRRDTRRHGIDRPADVAGDLRCARRRGSARSLRTSDRHAHRP